MVFHSIIGESFRTYLNRTRIEYYLSIKEKGGYKTNKELVLSSGFKSLVTFYRAYNSYIIG